MERVGKIVVLPSSMTTKGPNANNSKNSNNHLTLDALTCSVYEGDDDIDFASLSLPEAQERRMFDLQKDGVKWMYGLFLKNSGGILGDDMGLGKTFQVTALLTGLMTKQLVKRVLIITPVSVLPSWMRELTDQLKPYVPKACIELVNSDLPKKKRQQILSDTNNKANMLRPHIIVSSYALVSSMIEDFADFEWDYVILDEGHLIKNPTTKTTKAMHQLPSKHRLMLTGTPVQNNLKEFWTISDWVTKSKRFGSLQVFTERFITPIMNGQDPKATDFQRAISTEAIERLMILTKPILLQRKKCEQPAEVLKLPEKIEMVIWVPLATAQRTIYDQFLRSRAFSNALECSAYPVAVINHLKTLSRHPFLLEATEVNKRRKAQQSSGKGGSSKSLNKMNNSAADVDMDDLIGGFNTLNMKDNDNEDAIDGDGALGKLPPDASVFDIADREPNVHELFQGSVKLRVLSKLVFRLHRAGHRCLVFSQSRLMLDIIQRVLVEYRLSSYRIDGTTSQKDRQQIIDDFNDTSEDNTGPTICLLTTKACGTGITLTGADRVIIFDPSWNPAEDRQAVDRAFRIGQSKNVVVYRMIMASSVEEKMYEKQVFKDGLRIVTESGSSSRYFSSHETSDLFSLGPFDRSIVMEKFWSSVGAQMTTFPDTGGDLPGALGFTRHDTLYSEIRPQNVQDKTKDMKAKKATNVSVKGKNGVDSVENQENQKNRINSNKNDPENSKALLSEVVDLTQDIEQDKPIVKSINKNNRRIIIDDDEDECSDEREAVNVEAIAENNMNDVTNVYDSEGDVEVDMDWLREIPDQEEEHSTVEQPVLQLNQVVCDLTEEATVNSTAVLSEDSVELIEKSINVSVIPSAAKSVNDSLSPIAVTDLTSCDASPITNCNNNDTENINLEDVEAIDLCDDFAHLNVASETIKTPTPRVSLAPLQSPNVNKDMTILETEQSVDFLSESCVASESSFLFLDLCELKDAARRLRPSISPIKEGIAEDFSQPTDVPTELNTTNTEGSVMSDLLSPNVTTNKFLPNLFASPTPIKDTFNHTVLLTQTNVNQSILCTERAYRVDSQYEALQNQINMLSANVCAFTPLSQGDSLFTVQSTAIDPSTPYQSNVVHFDLGITPYSVVTVNSVKSLTERSDCNVEGNEDCDASVIVGANLGGDLESTLEDETVNNEEEVEEECEY